MGVADLLVAAHAGEGFRFVGVGEGHGVVRDVVVAVGAGVLGDALVTRFDLDGLVIVVQSEGEGVEESVVSLGHPFADRVVREMAVVADGGVVVAGFLPAVVIFLHDMAVGAGLRFVAQVTSALPVAEGEETDAARHADGAGQQDVAKAKGGDPRF